MGRARWRRWADWWFRDRRTGRVVVGQWPNLALAVWMVAAGVRLVVEPQGTAGTVVTAVGASALIVWALDEMARGVNPWRRLLGTAVLAAQVGALVS